MSELSLRLEHILFLLYFFDLRHVVWERQDVDGQTDVLLLHIWKFFLEFVLFLDIFTYVLYILCAIFLLFQE
jgi:hypothetical protein